MVFVERWLERRKRGRWQKATEQLLRLFRELQEVLVVEDILHRLNCMKDKDLHEDGMYTYRDIDIGELTQAVGEEMVEQGFCV